MNLQANDIKKIAYEFGADLCGIAPAARFECAPLGHHPCDLLPECRAVIVLACQFPADRLGVDTFEYTQARNDMTVKMDGLARRLAEYLQTRGVHTFAKTSMTNGHGKWEEDGRFRDTLSLKHAGMLAGLGKLGKNSLLINDRYGNMIWMSAVLVDLDLQGDPLADYEACLPNCHLCVASCPAQALGSPWIVQTRCFEYAYSMEPQPDGHEEETIHCNRCRVVCPRYLGIKSAQKQAVLDAN